MLNNYMLQFQSLINQMATEALGAKKCVTYKRHKIIIKQQL